MKFKNKNANNVWFFPNFNLFDILFSYNINLKNPECDENVIMI